MTYEGVKEQMEQTETMESTVEYAHPLDVYAYHRDDLGVTFHGQIIRIRVWAPTATAVMLNVYRTNRARNVEELVMERGEGGTWMIELDRRTYEGQYYTFTAEIEGKKIEALDPYVKVVGANGKRGCLLDPSTLNPERWRKERPLFHSSQQAILYRAHLRDLTTHLNSGVRNRGTFTGLTESGTKTAGGMPTGLDYITSLGITHLQLMPLNDDALLNEVRAYKEDYSWGYDPLHYFAVEGVYATTAEDPAARIIELKRMIGALHARGIRVVLEVSLDHTFDAKQSPLGQFVPGYYYRTNTEGRLTNGSGYGNDTASERLMMRKLMVDCVTYWVREFRVDGFSFQGMGVHDIETMNDIRSALDRIDPSILMLADGKAVDTALPVDQQANRHQTSRLPRIAQYNEAFCDGLRGESSGSSLPGWIFGNGDFTQDVKRGIAGAVTSQSFAKEPNQVINYVELPEQLTLWDQLSAYYKDEEEARRRQQLATAIVLLSQGIPSLHAGQEFFRTKNGLANSEIGGDVVNRIDWEQAERERPAIEYIKGLIALRKQYPLFRLENSRQIRKHLRFFDETDGVIAYELSRRVDGYVERHLVYHNSLEEGVTVKLPSGKFEVHVEAGRVNLTTPRLTDDREQKIEPLTTLVVTERRPDYNKKALAGGTAIAMLGVLYMASKRRKQKNGDS